MKILGEILQAIILITTIVLVVKPTLLKLKYSNATKRAFTIFAGLISMFLVAGMYEMVKSSSKRLKEEAEKNQEVAYNNVMQLLNDLEQSLIKEKPLPNASLDSLIYFIDSYEMQKEDEIKATVEFAYKANIIDSIIQPTYFGRYEKDSYAYNISQKYSQLKSLLEMRRDKLRKQLYFIVVDSVNHALAPQKIEFLSERVHVEGTNRFGNTKHVVTKQFAVCKCADIGKVKRILSDYAVLLNNVGLNEIRLGEVKQQKIFNAYSPIPYTDYFRPKDYINQN